MFKRLSVIFIGLLLFSCNEKQGKTDKSFKVAFMADVHLQDIYGTFSDNEYKGVLNSATGKYTLARTMQSQLQSTRLFNENYFAFLAALDDVASRNIKYVVLPGDFSDDGQMLNIKGLKRILKKYSEAHDIEFILTTGNHDPVRPFYQESGKHDFLGEAGKQQPIFSSEKAFKAEENQELNPIFTKDIAKLGYKEILSELKDFGFFPKEKDVYWETPFSDYTYSNYQFNEAIQQADLLNRNYEIPPFGNKIPDVSYLVEPTDGLWFLAIDANVYVPKNSKNYSSASIGYNNVLTHKKHLLNWIKTVTQRAEKLNKKLIVFSHYPTVDFNDGASEHIQNLLGETKMQLHRVPKEVVAKAFINAGVKVHFGGHMHINDTGIATFKNGSLVNVQIPSLAAYIPAYKIATVTAKAFKIETVVVDSVLRFRELFPLYKQEYEHLKKSNSKTVWDSAILEAKSYKDFTQFHLKELVRLRFLKEDWNISFTDFLVEATGEDLLKFASGDTKNNTEFKTWTGFDMLFDLYRLRSADALAFSDIGEKRLDNYKQIIELFQDKFQHLKTPSNRQKDFYQFCVIFSKFLNGAPSNCFVIRLDKNKTILY
ncbi:metallophosphoesterase family protein [Algibacter pectinivorans]|uniref:Calcineurin-like phosphoesterase n=1 Tax=Algibacter pectinivorans TaxID=870482 RepID=A0A1I1M3X1_9FLAO|nr:metallophosphoesterase [Algibacter pectinivorans]SFC80054.1 Calcineurin-like phosphoesterase [Algibacter pectinivorans]